MTGLDRAVIVRLRAASIQVLLVLLVLVGLLLSVALPGPALAIPHGAASWTFTAPLSLPRAFQTATLLPTGRVLVAGGEDQGFSINTANADLYNPQTGTFTPTGSMSTPREQHTATLLRSGLVLITGGANLYNGLSTAELYNPQTGTFTPTGSMSLPRVDHSATLLPSGQVLIAGGCNGTAFGCTNTTASAELYDPATGTFTPTGAMHSTRQWQTATLLPTGKVLIAGGAPCQGCYPLATAELYDPATGTFTPTGSMHTIRALATATLLRSGLVLIAGGCTNVSDACYPAQDTLASAELYNPWMGRFTLTGHMTVPRNNFTATRLASGQVLLAGGANGQHGGMLGQPLSSAELYTPWTGRFTATAAMSQTREAFTATLLPSGQVLATGGCPDSSGHCLLSPQQSAELYTPATP